MKLKKRLLSLAAALMALCLLVSCAPTNNGEQGGGEADPGSSGVSEKVIRFSIGAEPPTMDPQIKTATNMAAVATHVYEGLVRVFNGEIKPGMADTWEISPDGLTYTFHIRDGAKWSDGEDLTSADFAYAFQRILDPAVGSEFAYLAYDIVGAEDFNAGKTTDWSTVGVKNPDPSTFVVTLRNPVSYFLAFMDFTLFSPTRQDKVEAAGAAYGSEADTLAFNGPYVMESWEHDSNLVLVKNPEYWDAANITTDRIEVYVVLDENTGVAMYDSGDLDITNVPKDLIPAYDTKIFTDGGEYFLMANHKGMTAETGKLLSNPNFMKAIGYGIDREAFIKATLGDATQPATRYNMPLLNIINNAEGKQVNFNEAYPLEAYPATADLTKAQEYLDLALQETGFTKDTMPTFSYACRDADSNRLMAEALQDMLKTNLGINMEIRQMEYKQWLEVVNNHEYDICLYGWGPDYDDPMTYMDLWMVKPGAMNNMANYDNQEYTDLLNLAKTTPDAKERAEALYKAEQILLDGGPIIPIYVKYTAYVQNPSIDNIDRPFIGGQPKCMYATFN